MKLYLKYIIFFGIIFCSIQLYAQKNEKLIIDYDKLNHDTVYKNIISLIQNSDDVYIENLEKAKLLLDSANLLINDSNYNKLHNLIIKKLIRITQSQDSNNLALKYIQKLENKALKYNDTSLLIEAYQYKAQLILEQGDLDQAIHVYNEALRYSNLQNNLYQKAEIVALIGDAYGLNGLLSIAIDYLYEARQIAEELEDEYLKATIYMYIAQIHSYENNYEKALEFNMLSYDIYSAQKDIENIAISSVKIAESYYNLHELKKAELFYKNAIKDLEHLDNQYWLAYAYNGIGLVYEDLNHFDLANEYFVYSLSIRQQLNDIEELADSYITLGEHYARFENYDIAQQYLERGLNYAKQINALKLIKRASNALSKIFEFSDDFENAYLYHVMYKNSADSLLNKENTRNLTQIEMQHKFDKERKLTELIQSQNEAEIESTRKFNIVLFAGIFVLLLFSILLIRNYRLQKTKSKLLQNQKLEIQEKSEELELKNEELGKLSIVASKTDNGVIIISKNDDIEWINQGLKQLLKVTDEQLRAILNHNIKDYFIGEVFIENYNNCIANKHSVSFEFKANNKLWLQTTLTPIYENNKIHKVIAVFSDITKIKEAEEEIQRNKRELETQANLLSIYNSELNLQKTAVTEQNEELIQQKEELTTQAEQLERNNKELEKLSIIASKTTNGVVVLSKSGTIEWMNEGFAKMHKFSYDSISSFEGKNIIEISHNTNILQDFNKCILEKKSVQYENQTSINGNEGKWVQTTLTPIIEDEEVVKVIAIDTDISKLKKAEYEVIRKSEEIQEQADKLDALVKKLEKQSVELEQKNAELEKLSIVASKTDNSIFITDPNGHIIWVNEAFTRHSGYTRDEFLKIRGNTLFTVSSNPDIIEAFKKAKIEKKSITYTSLTQTKNNENIWLQTTLTPILTNDNQIYQFIAINSDITQVKRAEKKIAEQNREITDSIEYASRIQSALQPMSVFLDAVLGEYFILNLPKNIVSGDFHWVGHKGNKTIVAVSDCTGHGIPGAFMSMLGTVILQSIINKQNNFTAGSILNELRQRIIKVLHQRGKDGEAQDGMDVALCILDHETDFLQYAGAYASIFVIKPLDNNEYENFEDFKNIKYSRKINEQTNAQLLQLKPDKMPIGIHSKDTIPFKNNVIKIEFGDLIYMTSDGYTDQFGGPKNKKFFVVNFEKTLLKIHQKPLPEQKEILHDLHNEWKGQHEQVDDIHVMGIKYVDLI